MCLIDNLCDKILASILAKTFERRHDTTVLQTVCCFFNKMCERSFKIDYDQLLRLFFDNPEPVARKQGIFIVKTLIEHKKLSKEDEENFKKFVVVVEALEESQHLILPTMELVKSLKFSQPFEDFPFLMYRMIINHDSSTVKTWGLNFVIGTTNNFNDVEIEAILDALNSSCLFDADQADVDTRLLNVFVNRNFKSVFQSLTRINWASVSFYRILQIVTKIVESLDSEFFDNDFLYHLLKQTELIPKQICSVVIRLGVQSKYAAIVTKLNEFLSVKSLLPIIINIFNIANGYKCLEKCLRSVTPDEYEAVFNDKWPKLSFDCFLPREVFT